MDLHPDLEPLAPLLGTWAGRGAGQYPTIQPFEYLEEVVFSHVGKPFLGYGQKTKAVADGRPMHAETGYLRVPEPGRVATSMLLSAFSNLSLFSSIKITL